MLKKIFAAALGAAALAAQAAPVANGGFETATFGGDYCYGPACGIADWTVAAPTNANGWTGPVLISTNSGPWGNPGLNDAAAIALGNYVLGLQNTSTDIVGGVSSGIASNFLVQAGHTYELTWDDAGRAGYAAHSYDIQAGGVDLGTFATAGGQAWGQHTVSFTAQTDGALSFTGLLGGTSGYDGTSFIDNVDITVTSVPEPMSLTLMALGTLGLLTLRRRRAD
jgi:hypothetical protein